MSQATRHQQLLSAGWSYDASSDRYTAPNSATDGTAKQYNLEAAWRAFTADDAPAAPNPQPPTPNPRRSDPRHKEPE